MKEKENETDEWFCFLQCEKILDYLIDKDKQNEV